MSTKIYKDKHNNEIVFRPYDKKNRYSVNGNPKSGCTSTIEPRFGKDGLVRWAKRIPIDAIEWQLKDDGMAIDKINEYINKIKQKVDKLSFQDAETGTMMHSLCEDYINKKKVPMPESEPLKNMFQRFKIWWDSKDFEVIETEKTYYSEELDSCGTVDCIVKSKKWGNKLAVLDFKTSKTIDYSNYAIQIGAYKKMIEDSSDYKISYMGLVHIPKLKDMPITFRRLKPQKRYIQAYKACEFLKNFEKQYSSDLSAYKKKQKEKKNVSKK